MMKFHSAFRPLLTRHQISLKQIWKNSIKQGNRTRWYQHPPIKGGLTSNIAESCPCYQHKHQSRCFSSYLQRSQGYTTSQKNSTNERGNYHPISVLPVLSKPLERHVATAYVWYLSMNKLLYKNQSQLTAPTILVKLHYWTPLING